MFRVRNPSSATQVLLFGFICFCCAEQVRADDRGILELNVVAADGSPVHEARVRIVELDHALEADDAGVFRSRPLQPGDYLVSVRSDRHGNALVQTSVPVGQVSSMDVVLDRGTLSDEIIVTTHDERARHEVAQPVSVLSGLGLEGRREASLGETLAQESGVTSTYFGPGASRPVIRGLGGDRIRLLHNGVGTGDISNISVDHTVSLDVMTAEKVEIVRGPATLLYGSSAIGGVVNVIDQRIPDIPVNRALTGELTYFAGSVADESTGAINLNGGGDSWAWHLDGLRRSTDDISIPGFAESAGFRALEDEHGDEHEGDEQEHAFGTLPNSDIDTESVAAGVSWFFGERGFLGISVSEYESNYGIAGHHDDHGHEGEEGGEGEHADDEHGEEEGDEHGDEGVRIDVQHERVNLRGRMAYAAGPFDSLSLRLGLNDYQHVEGANLLDSEGWEGRLELRQRTRGRFSGSLGVQAQKTDFSNIGSEAFVPPTDTESRAIFAFEEVAVNDDLRLEFGLRYESVDTRPVASSGLPERSFSGVSTSFGSVWQPAEAYTLALSLARAIKMPTSKELYAFGVHPSTQTFEIGDQDLGEEVSTGLDFTIRKVSGRVTGELSLFHNLLDDYIYQRFTDEERSGVPVVAYTHDDAEFTGAELKTEVTLSKGSAGRLDLLLSGDVVRARLRSSHDALPRIPPRRFGVALRYHAGPWHARVEARRHQLQDRVAENETTTDGFTRLNAYVSRRVLARKWLLDVMVRGTNLTNEEGRNHVSFNKDRVPLPGRDVGLSLRFVF